LMPDAGTVIPPTPDSGTTIPIMPDSGTIIPMDDAGTTSMDMDAGTTDDAGPPHRSRGGCACSTPAHSSSSPILLVIAGLAIAIRRRRSK